MYMSLVTNNLPSNQNICVVSALTDLRPLTNIDLMVDLFTGGVQHKVSGEGKDYGEDDSGQGEGDVGGARVETDGDQRVDHWDVALHRQRDGQVHWQHQARLNGDILFLVGLFKENKGKEATAMEDYWYVYIILLLLETENRFS